MSRRKFLQNGAILSLGQVAGYGLVFVRTWLLAHLISRADVGIAATLQLAVFLFDMLSDLSLGTMLVQARDGEEPLLQSTAQAIGAFRGVISTLLLIGLAWPIAYVMAVPQTRGAFQWLALVLLLKGFSHLDTFRLQRQHDYRPAVTADVLSQLLVTLAVWPLALLNRDYWIMVWVLVIQAAAFAGLSQLLSRRRYSWEWDRRYARQLVSFGWPLLINGFLLFGIFQGDRAILAAQRIFPAYTKEDLAVYSVAFSLTLIPTMVIAKVASGLLLPQLSRLQQEPAKFTARYVLMLEGLSLIAGAMTITFIMAGGGIVVLLYGRQYGEARSFIGWLAAMQGIRLVRVGTTLGALARGDTRNSMISNLARSAGLIGAVVVATQGAAMNWIAAAGFAGEVLALAVSVFSLWIRHRVPMTSCVRPVLLLIGGIAVALIVAGQLAHVGQLAGSLGCAVVVGVFVAIAAVLSRNMRCELRSSMLALAGR